MPRLPKGTPTGYYLNDIELKLGDIVEGPLGLGFVHTTKVQFKEQTLTIEEFDSVSFQYQLTNKELDFSLTKRKKSNPKSIDDILAEPITKPVTDEEWRRSGKIIDDLATKQDEARLLASTLRVGEFASSKKGTGIITRIHGDRVSVAAFVTESGIESRATIGFKSLKYSTRYDKLNWDAKIRSAGYEYDSESQELISSIGQLISPGDYVAFEEDEISGVGIVKTINHEDDKPYSYVLVGVVHNGLIIPEYSGQSPLTLCNNQMIRQYNTVLASQGIVILDDYSIKKVVNTESPTQKPSVTEVLLKDATEHQIQQELKVRGFKGSFRKEYEI